MRKDVACVIAEDVPQHARKKTNGYKIKNVSFASLGPKSLLTAVL